MEYQIYDLDLTPGGSIVNVHVSQYDNGRPIKFNLFYKGSPYSVPSGTTAYIEGTKPDKRGFSLPATVSGSTAYFNTTQNMCAVAGKTICEFRLLRSGENIGTQNFILDVERAGLADDVDISETELPIYIDAAKSNAKDAEAWAVGTKEGVPVSSSDPQYNNYSKHYAEQANASAITASNSAETANGRASDAEAWAVGKRGGVPVPSSDDTYQNNSKHYAGIAEELIRGGIPEGTTITFYVSNGHLYVQQTIDGVQQPAQDLGMLQGVAVQSFATVAAMNTAIAGGTVPEGALCCVQQNIVMADTTNY